MSPNAPETAAQRLADIRNRMDRAANRIAGSVPAELVAVSKTFDADTIIPVIEAGQRHFGENRVQEAQGKWPDLKAAYPNIVLHLIGPLQTNKAGDAVALFDVIESVDRDKLARILASEMEKQDRKLPCFVQVNIGGEEQKAGVALEPYREFDITEAETAAAALETAKSGHFDLMLLDVGLPDMDGREALKIMRNDGFRAPVIMLTGQDSESDEIRGLESGANDYVTKPFRFSVLLARMRAALRQHDQSEDVVFTIGPYSFQPAAKTLENGDGSKIRLTDKETAILKFLYRQGPKTISRDILLAELRLLAFVCEEISLAPGDALYAAGDAADGAYVLVSGALESTHSPVEGRGQFRIEPVALVGELGLMLTRPRGASVKASRTSTLLFVPRAPFMKLLRSHPELAEDVAATLRAELSRYLDSIAQLGERFSK
eukprot:jgi/Tetstr1/452154/TSEL_039190.t1